MTTHDKQPENASTASADAAASQEPAAKENPNAPKPSDTVRSPLAFGRETIESIVVAFTLALLFRAFEAEAFVIPTGSMAPTLMGRHKDLICDSCGLAYRVGCSAEEDDQSQGLRMELARLEREVVRLRAVVESSLSTPREREEARRQLADLEREDGPIAQRRARLDSKLVAAGTCPNCGLPVELLQPRNGGLEYDPRYPSFNGDRILVNKFAYDFADPERWDVVVFRYPEDAKINYIKRLVGLPGETVSIAAGDIWTSRDGQPPRIARKPDRKLLAMLQCVHDAGHRLDFPGRRLLVCGRRRRGAGSHASVSSFDSHRRTVGNGACRRVACRRRRPDLDHRLSALQRARQPAALGGRHRPRDRSRKPCGIRPGHLRSGGGGGGAPLHDRPGDG
jgi:signal peptidase I